MAELDRFERTFQAGWRAAYRHAREGVASDEEIGDKLVKTLAKVLRESDGVPGLPLMVSMVAGMEGTSLLELFGALDSIVRNLNGHRHSKVAAEIAKSLLVQQNSLTRSPTYEDAVRQLSGDVCRALVEHYYFANARQHLVTEGKVATPEAARHWQNKIEQLIQPALERIASQLAQSPDASGLRAPRRMVKKQSTSNLLNEELLPTPAGVPS